MRVGPEGRVSRRPRHPGGAAGGSRAGGGANSACAACTVRWGGRQASLSGLKRNPESERGAVWPVGPGRLQCTACTCSGEALSAPPTGGRRGTRAGGARCGFQRPWSCTRPGAADPLWSLESFGGVCSLFLRLTKRWPFSACHSAQELPTGVSASSIPRHSAIRAPRSDANPVQQPAVLCCKEGPTVPQISPNTTSLTRNPFLINQEESTSPHPPPTPATLILPQRKLQGRCPSGGHTQPLPRCPSLALCQWGSEL